MGVMCKWCVGMMQEWVVGVLCNLGFCGLV